MWASCIHYLNDSQEFKHGLEVAKRIIEERLPGASGAQKQFLERSLGALEQYSEGFVYVASFAENGDLLSQWRGYASPAGVSIGFNFHHVREAAARNGFRLIKCIYQDSTKRVFANEVLNGALGSMPADGELPADIIEKASYRFVLNFYQIAASFKDASFAEENEWRIISNYTPVTHENVKVRATPRMLIPYYEVSLDLGKVERDRKNIGLELVIVGPGPQQELIAKSVGVATFGKGVWMPSQMFSRIPYRTL